MEIITGRNTVLEAIRGRRSVRAVYVAKDHAASAPLSSLIKEAEEKGVRVVFLDRQTMEKRFGRIRQYVAAEVSEFAYADYDAVLEKLCEKKNALVVLLDGIEDPQNLGNIIRTAEFFGADAVVLRKKRACGVTPVVERIAQGACAYIPVARVANIGAAVEKAKEHGFTAVAAFEGAAQRAEPANMPQKCALVVGGEDSGVSRLVRERCDLLLSLPGTGHLNSINAASAFAVYAYLWRLAVEDRKSADC